MLTSRTGNSSKLSFLYESAATTETIGRYSFVGAGVWFSRFIFLWLSRVRDGVN